MAVGIELRQVDLVKLDVLHGQSRRPVPVHRPYHVRQWAIDERDPEDQEHAVRLEANAFSDRAADAAPG